MSLDEEIYEIYGVDELSLGEIQQTRPAMTVFVLADTSRSMIRHGNINKLNSAIQELRPQLRRLQGADAEVRVAICTFGETCEWHTKNEQHEPDAVPVDEFRWDDVKAAGQTPMGSAFKALNAALSRQGFIHEGEMYYKPVILLITDGMPTDDWEEAAEALQGNGWFRNAIRVAIGPKEAAESVLVNFTGNKDSIVEFPGPGAGGTAADRLAQLIVGITLRASRVSTQTRSARIVREPEEIAAEVVRQTVEDPLFSGIGDISLGSIDDGFDANAFDDDDTF